MFFRRPKYLRRLGLVRPGHARIISLILDKYTASEMNDFLTLLGSTSLLARTPRAQTVPLFTSRVSCGFPSPAEDFVESMTSLDEIAIRNPAATYLMRAGGDSMIGAGIYPLDIIVVDRSLRARHRSIVTAVYDGEFVCKRLLETDTSVILLAPENPAYPPIVIPNPDDLVIWGVCVFNLHDLRRQ